MSQFTKPTILVIALLLSASVRASAQTGIFDRFDAFGDIKCEDEMARLDNFAIQLQNEPRAKGVIIFYGGQLFRSRLPKRGEAEARAARLKPYLVERRGIPADQVVVINGGYTKEWQVTLWVVPAGVSNPTGDTSSSIPAKKIKFRKGKVNPRDYRCGV